MKKSETFCVKPWIHMATYTSGEALMCCVAKEEAGNLNKDKIEDIWNNEHYRKARLAMLSGKKISACQKCYSEEDGGVNSHRIVENHVWMEGQPSKYQPHCGEDFIDELINKTDESGYLDASPISFDFRLGNTCNLQCVMCGPKDSSKWVNFSKQLGQDMSTWDTSKFNWVEDEEFWTKQFFPLLPNIQHLILAGGEPLLLKQHTQLLERIIAEGYAKNIKIRYHTNGTIMSDRILKLWEEFKGIDLFISIDAWGDKNSWIRYPDMWKDIMKNLHKVDDTPDNISPRINCTVNAYNVFYIPDFCDWTAAQNFKKINMLENGGGFPSIGYVHGPTHLNCKVLPKDVKQIITDKYDKWYNSFDKKWYGLERVHKIVEFMNSEDKSKHFKQFISYTNKVDTIRNTNFQKTFPEFAAIL
jgi:MoaA/NifB/PqqE/SkfB family radical SAM enzyme